MSIKFHLPSFTTHYKMNMLFLEMFRNCPQFMRDNIKIASFFDSFPPSVWSGGRTMHQVGLCDETFIDSVIRNLNGMGIPLRFTFTNPVLRKEHLGDRFSNMLLKKASGGLNEVIVVSPLLEEYIRKEYPEYKITSSTCKRLDDIDSFNEELSKPYSMVVLDYDLNNRYDLLEKIADKKRTEILINPSCTPRCPRRKSHYASTGFVNIAFAEYVKKRSNKDFDPMSVPRPSEMKIGHCPTVDYSLYKIKNFETFITADDLYEKYVPMGFEHFKIEGRTASMLSLIEHYIYYTVKPEQQAYARFMFYNNLRNNGMMRI